jgi:hypothetical protein
VPEAPVGTRQALGRPFVSHLEAAAQSVDVPTGVGPAVADEYEIDIAVFTNEPRSGCYEGASRQISPLRTAA